VKQPPAFALVFGALPEQSLKGRRHLIERRLGVARIERVDKHQRRQSVGRPLGDTSDDHAGVAVTDEDHVTQVASDKPCDHVVDVAFEGDGR
jgi:hypothetical protein